MSVADRWSPLKESHGVTLATGSPLSFLHTYGWSSRCLFLLLSMESLWPSFPGSRCGQAVSGHFREVLSLSLAVPCPRCLLVFYWLRCRGVDNTLLFLSHFLLHNLTHEFFHFCV